MTAVGRLNEVCGMWNMEGLRGESHLGDGLTGMGCLPMPATRSARPMPAPASAAATATAASGEFENMAVRTGRRSGGEVNACEQLICKLRNYMSLVFLARLNA